MTSAVLFSGGLDSAVLLADEAARGPVHPIYVSAGLAWEPAERTIAESFVAALAARAVVAPLVTLTVEMRDVYAATHWALQGRPPAYDTPDEDVYLPGRNIILIAKAAVYAAATGCDRIVLGTLAHNPFPDATPEFRDAIARAVSLGLAHPLAVDAPYASMSKADVIRQGVALGVPLTTTLSCMNPRPIVIRGSGSGIRGAGSPDTAPAAGTRSSGPAFDRSVLGPGSDGQSLAPDPQSVIHCGACSKCRERHDAFNEAGIADPTRYAVPPPR